MNSDFGEFRFTPSMLAAPRPPGISAYMRIKNGAEFLRLAIESHLPFYDEIVAVYNGCTDNTEEILLQLQAQHPDKIRVFHYLPKVAKLHSEEHRKTPTDSVHGMANYSNYALAKTRYSVAAKLDDDHLAVPRKLALLIEQIRADIAAGKRQIYTFSGLNVIRKNGTYQIGGIRDHPFCGNGEHLYHPVSPDYTYRQGDVVEEFSAPPPQQVAREYAGIMFFHLKHLKKGGGYDNLDAAAQPEWRDQLLNRSFWMSWAEFCSEKTRRQMIADRPFRDRIDIAMYSSKTIRNLKLRLTGKHPNIHKIRLVRLPQDLAGIDFERDLVRVLETHRQP